MKIAVLSDIHDNIWNLEKVLRRLKKKKISIAILCGDYCAPTTFRMATEKLKKAYCVWGNVGGEKFRITQQIYKNNISHVHLLGELGEIEIGGRKLVVNHYPDIGERLAQSGKYDAVFHGHTHVARNEKVGKTLLINPGPVCGFKNNKEVPASYAIYDTKTNSGRIIEIN
jgi:putative phosphoesterase